MHSKTNLNISIIRLAHAYLHAFLRKSRKKPKMGPIIKKKPKPYPKIPNFLLFKNETEVKVETEGNNSA